MIKQFWSELFLQVGVKGLKETGRRITVTLFLKTQGRRSEIDVRIGTNIVVRVKTTIDS